MERTGLLLFGTEDLGDLVAHLAIGHLDIVLQGAVIAHEVQVAVVGNIELRKGRVSS